MASLGRVQLDLPYGGGLTITANGGLKTVNDLDDAGAATMQWLERLIMTSPTLKDANGAPIARADDLFNPTFGAGGRRAVGSLLTPELINSAKSQILAGIAANPYISQTPPPSVSVSDGGNGILFLGPVSVTTIAGQTFTLPSRPVSVGG